MEQKISLQRVAVSSPFRVLRERSGLTLAEMAKASYLKPQMLEALEADALHLVEYGSAAVKDALFRVACVACVRMQHPTADIDGLDTAWGDLEMELLNTFNEAAMRG
jgi:hypothetical protein